MSVPKRGGSPHTARVNEGCSRWAHSSCLPLSIDRKRLVGSLPKTNKLKHHIHKRVSPAVRDIAMKAQACLCARYRSVHLGNRENDAGLISPPLFAARCARGHGRGTPAERFVAGIADARSKTPVCCVQCAVPGDDMPFIAGCTP
jgi:hypothetical protein